MIDLFRPGKLLLAALTVSATVAAVAPASADVVIVRHRGPAMMRTVRGPHCFTQRTVFRGPRGGRRVVVRRICR